MSEKPGARGSRLGTATALALVTALFAAPAVARAQELGDPTRPTSLAPHGGSGGESAGPRWRLQSTLVADTRRLAVINGHTVKAGERVDGATVVEVRTDGVVLDYEGQRMEIRLLQSGIKRRNG